MRYPNIVEFKVSGKYGMFSDPITRVGGEKSSYHIPTYEALKGILASIYWKPTIIWYIDKVRVMKKVQMEVKGIRTIKYNGGNDLSYYTYLKDCEYQVQAHFEWNMNRPELMYDRNENKHHEIAKRNIKKGGRRDIFLGTRECQGYVEPCVFGEGEGAYDECDLIDYGIMYHGITYADEAYSDETKNKMSINLWHAKMEKGIIKFVKPSECPIHKIVHDMKIKEFGEERNNFIGLDEFKEV